LLKGVAAWQRRSECNPSDVNSRSMAVFNSRSMTGAGNIFVVVTCALSFTAWPFAGAAVEKACVDDDAKWVTYNSNCTQMQWLCNNDGYGVLVRKWCPRTCGLCEPSPSDVDGDLIDDTVVLIGGRPDVSVGPSSLELSVARKQRKNATSNHSRGDRVRSSNHSRGDTKRPRTPSRAPSFNKSQNDTFKQVAVVASVNLTDDTGASEGVGARQPITQWEITLEKGLQLQDAMLSSGDALVKVLSKAQFIPRALWSSDQDHFVFEVGNASQNGSDNVSTEAFERDRLSSSTALEEEEDPACPGGYEEVVGHVYGGDQFGRGYNLYATSMRECARWCTNTPGCGSFDYSTRNKRCFRNSQTRPTSLLERGGFVFCRRAPCPSFKTEAACLGPQIKAGFHSAEVRLRPGSYCIWSKEVCQAPMACTYEDCFLPDGGLPGMNLPISKTLWISRAAMMSTMGSSSLSTPASSTFAL